MHSLSDRRSFGSGLSLRALTREQAIKIPATAALSGAAFH